MLEKFQSANSNELLTIFAELVDANTHMVCSL